MAREYERSHPWIRFRADLSAAAPEFWMLLGEAASKCEHVAGVPLQPAVAEAVHRLYLVKGALASTAIEGNTLTEQQALDVVAGKLRLPPSQEYLAHEVENVIAACQWIADEVARGAPPALDTDLVRGFNAKVLSGLDLEEGVTPGEIRSYSVGVASYRGAPPEDCEHLVARLCEWLASEELAPRSPAQTVPCAILRAALAHLYLAWIHPFGDGNGRTARLVELLILISSGVPSACAHLLSNHYNQTRAEYYRQLQRATDSGGDVLPFLTYAVAGFVEQLRGQLAYIREQQWWIAWENFVDERFRGERGDGAVRRKQLLLDLARAGGFVSKADLRSLSPRVAADYARKTDKTLSRDLNALAQSGLIEQSPEGYRARRELILAFLPLRAADL